MKPCKKTMAARGGVGGDALTPLGSQRFRYNCSLSFDDSNMSSSKVPGSLTGSTGGPSAAILRMQLSIWSEGSCDEDVVQREARFDELNLEWQQIKHPRTFNLRSTLPTQYYLMVTTNGVKRKSQDVVEDQQSASGSSSNNSDTKPVKKRAPQRPRTENFTREKYIRKDGIYPMNKFPYHLPYRTLNLRKQPHLYRPGVGEQGVLMVEPYKSELLPDWKFKDPETATKSSIALRKHFEDYVEKEDFIGADMARKFIQVSLCPLCY